MKVAGIFYSPIPGGLLDRRGAAAPNKALLLSPHTLAVRCAVLRQRSID
jgi:hypothetical protein